MRLRGSNVGESRYEHYNICCGRVIFSCSSAIATFGAGAQIMRDMKCLATPAFGSCKGAPLK